MKLGIIGAMSTEVAHLKSQMSGATVTTIASMDFCEGRIGNVECVVVQSGVGKVNAAACTQILASIYKVDKVINTGAAGSLDARIDINDLVVSTDAVHHDMDVANLGYKLGQVPQMSVFSFEADPQMRAAVAKAAAEVAPDIKVWEGRVLSGDQFIRDDEVKDRIAAEFGGLCAEMEGAAIAQVCYLNSIPFVIVRAISDKADGSMAVEYQEFEDIAAEHCARIVEYIIAHI